jgi:hypothetical protein
MRIESRDQRHRLAEGWHRLLYAIVYLFIQGCAPGMPPQTANSTPTGWNQIGGDYFNSNSALWATANLTATVFLGTVVKLTQSGDPSVGTPVIGPDGTVYVSVYDPKEGSHIESITPLATHLSADVFWAGNGIPTAVGQISTPAIDASGNLYVVVNSLNSAPSQQYPGVVQAKDSVVKIDKTGKVVWTVMLVLPAYQTPAPKLYFDPGYNKLNIFVPSRVGEIISLSVIDGDTGELHSVQACSYPISNSGGGATVTPSAPPAPPYAESPVSGLFPDYEGKSWLVMPTNGCGINFYDLEATSQHGWEFGLAYPKQINAFPAKSNITSYSSPSISRFSGYALIAESETGETTIYAYDVTSGKRIPRWQIGGVDLCNVALATLWNSAVFCPYAGTMAIASVQPLDYSTLTPTIASTDGLEAAVISLNSIYVHARDGLFRYGTNFNLLNFVSIPASNGGGMAVGPDGTLYVAASDGNLYVFVQH